MTRDGEGLTMDGVKQNEPGLWDVFVGGEMIARVGTNREGWNIYDRRVGEHRSKAEETSDWVFGKDS